MARVGRALTPYHRQLSSGPTVVVRNGFLDLEPVEAKSALCRTLSAPARLAPATPRARPGPGGEDDACIVMSVVDLDAGPSAMLLEATSATFKATRDTTSSGEGSDVLGCAHAALGRGGCGKPWLQEDTGSDAETCSWISSPPLSATTSPPWSLPTSPLLVAAMPPLVLPEALPQMTVLPASSVGVPLAPPPSCLGLLSRQEAAWPASPQQQPKPRPSPKARPASPQLRPQDVPEFAPAALAADPTIGAAFREAAPTTARSIAHGVSAATGVHRVVWTVDAAKLRSHERQAVSPSFELPLGGESVATRLVLFPRPPTGARGGASFKKSQGWGSVQLKCEASAGSVVFQVSVGDGARQTRGPVLHDFADHSTCGLPKGSEHWDLGRAVNKSTQTFSVCLDILPRGGP